MYDYYGRTTLHPLGLTILLILGFFMLVLPKGKTIIPCLVLACFIAPGQRIVMLGLDFNFIRMMVLFGWIRILLRNEAVAFRFQPADKLMVAWAITKTVLHTVQYHGDPSALIYMTGMGFESLGMYFLVRILVTTTEDIWRIGKTLMIISFPIAVFFLFEKTTGRNLFSMFGGVPEITMIRDGRLRVTGAFAHPILAGSFWASTIPMVMAGIFRDGKFSKLAIASLCCILAIIAFCASSTPIIGVLLSFTGMAFFFLRFRMAVVRLWGATGLFALMLVMKQPVWHLLGRIDIVGGSTGYYRYLLIDRAVRNFPEWCLVGLSSTLHWSDGTGEILTDIVNQYILEGLEGGFLTLALFCAVIVVCFGCVEKAIAGRTLSRDNERLSWALGATLFTHSMMFLVVSYFGQIVMLWNIHLALTVCMYHFCTNADQNCN